MKKDKRQPIFPEVGKIAKKVPVNKVVELWEVKYDQDNYFYYEELTLAVYQPAKNARAGVDLMILTGPEKGIIYRNVAVNEVKNKETKISDVSIEFNNYTTKMSMPQSDRKMTQEEMLDKCEEKNHIRARNDFIFVDKAQEKVGELNAYSYREQYARSDHFIPDFVLDEQVKEEGLEL